jgi:hypothetical protein
MTMTAAGTSACRSRICSQACSNAATMPADENDSTF